MNSSPIGVFDSGLGGLTAVKRLAQLLPHEEIIYLGDTGRVPYGSRSRDTIIKYAREDARFLLSHGIKAMIVACNTVSSSALDVIAPEIAVPVFGVVEPPSARAASLTKNGKIGVIGTAATVRSGAYAAAIVRIDAKLEVTSAACPLFVPLAENGRVSADDIAVTAIARDYLRPIIDSGADTVILGCTHYPLLAAAISRVLGGGVTLVDSGAVTAEFVAERLRSASLLTDRTGPGRRRYFVTDSAEDFAAQGSVFLEADISGTVEQITLG
jgi:glutamate racemase